MCCFVDAYRAGDKLTHCSRSGFIIILQIAPICYFSKCQNTVKNSTFGSQFMAMKLAWEYIPGLQYKIRMIGIPSYDPCFMYGDNKSVLYNTKLPE